MLKLPCPKCGDVGNFDGWGSNNAYEALHQRYPDVYDDWSAMKAIAKIYKVVWEPSPDNTWFRRP